MDDPVGEIARLLDLMRLGDEHARSLLIFHVWEQFRRLTRHMLRDYPRLRRWEQTDDVFQNAMIRLKNTLEVKTPESVRHFHNLTVSLIRNELIDLARHHLGPEGHGAKHHTDGQHGDGVEGPVAREPDRAGEPSSLEDWTAFHKAVGCLPDEEREVIYLLWYEGLNQQQAADALKISLRTIRRRWQSARLKLIESLDGQMPVG